MATANRNKLKRSSHGQPGDECREDLVHDLSSRIDTLRRCEQYMMNADGHPVAVDYWQDIREQETDNVKRLQMLLEIQMNQKDVRLESHFLGDSDELLSASAGESRSTTGRHVPVA